MDPTFKVVIWIFEMLISNYLESDLTDCVSLDMTVGYAYGCKDM